MTQVQHNMNALTAYNKLNTNVAGLKKSSEKLASGYRINRAGDDAAGLAISEKMRSQIKGLNQAIRNSQDGINMIQTYEGAAQETHSILQRMKELAVESANGTYDNATDRAAIQLEFDQLNDELNQIADTDFNGTVVLNGGVMADGTVATNGEFRYANGVTETTVAAKATDISGEQADKLCDQTNYNKNVADAVYNAVGVKVSDVADPATKKAEIKVTFMYDGERWVADTVTDKDGNVIKGANAARLEAREVDLKDASGKGGFEVIAGKDPMTGKDIIATNAIFDEMTGPVKKGDTVTIKFENSAATTYAPDNGGVAEDTIKVVAGAKFTEGEVRNLIGFELGESIKDANMTSDLKAVLDDFTKVAKASVEYAGGKVADKSTITITGTNTVATYAVAEDGTVTATSKATNKEYILGKITADQFVGETPAKAAVATDATTTAAANAITFKTGDEKKVSDALVAKLDSGAKATDTAKFTITATYAKGTAGTDDDDTWNIAYSYVDADGNTQNKTATMTGSEIKACIDTGTTGTYNRANLTGGETIKIDYTAATSKKTDLDATKEGTVEFQFNVDAYNYADMSDLNVHAVATPKVATMADQVATPGVSKADSFDNSTGVLTYTDNLTLQTGARTKDSVNFSFSYNTDKTADMGSLVANLDLSARSTGLNTASLSLADQKSANYAVDQIDKAINKTSMVRATFGSIQNRLEHKITNLTTTSENLTEAESSIRDTDMASEMMNYTKFNILQQAAQSMLAQANQQPQSILQLLG